MPFSMHGRGARAVRSALPLCRYLVASCNYSPVQRFWGIFYLHRPETQLASFSNNMYMASATFRAFSLVFDLKTGTGENIVAFEVVQHS